MRNYSLLTLILGIGLSLGAVACEEDGGDVESELQDLEEAREQAPEVSQELQQQLEESKAEVVRLEEQLALAQQGITDEVREERQDLAESLAEEQQDVRQEIGETREEAQRYNQMSDEARQALRETQGATVEARVDTETEVTPRQGEIESQRVETTIPLETTEVETEQQEREVQQQQPTDDQPVRSAKPIER
jgi:ribosomal protein L29